MGSEFNILLVRDPCTRILISSILVKGMSELT